MDEREGDGQRLPAHLKPLLDDIQREHEILEASNEDPFGEAAGAAAQQAMGESLEAFVAGAAAAGVDMHRVSRTLRRRFPLAAGHPCLVQYSENPPIRARYGVTPGQLDMAGRMALTPAPAWRTRWVRSAGSWAFWIAGLTVLNALLMTVDQPLRSPFSLIAPFYVLGRFWNLLGSGGGDDLLGVAVWGFFVGSPLILLGIHTLRGRRWAPLCLAVLWALDTIALLTVFDLEFVDILYLVVHFWVLVVFVLGYRDLAHEGATDTQPLLSENADAEAQ